MDIDDDDPPRVPSLPPLMPSLRDLLIRQGLLCPAGETPPPLAIKSVTASNAVAPAPLRAWPRVAGFRGRRGERR